MYKVQANLTPNQAQTCSRISCSNAKSDRGVRIRANLHEKADGIPENRSFSSLRFMKQKASRKDPEGFNKMLFV